VSPGFDPDAVAAALRRIRLDRTVVLPLAGAPSTVTEGAQAQLALARLVGSAVPAGFKIGATGKRMQEYLGLTGPAAGFMEAGNIYRDRADLRFADYIKPGVECEIAVRLAHDLPPGAYTAETVTGAVGEVIAGVEIVENRYDDLVALGTPTLIADQVYHCAAVTGALGGIDWRGLDLGALRGRISVDGVVRDEGISTDLMGHPFNCLAWLASSDVAAAFGGLKAGQTVMLGSVTPPVWLDAPGTVTVEFAPLPAVTVLLG
jgi:2-keto-4-pentenoate hydratase